jgi:hypothetical protein
MENTNNQEANEYVELTRKSVYDERATPQWEGKQEMRYK